ncbi:MAG: hypothetical protein HRU18_11235 [Pseudoalteromonas sp.]|uniref:helix-turn-helix domain-containing protein n=1 Tax=Pseudoalteromonas sp. TaxID=53249 RepID=UPI001DEBBA6F|nr:helix-turn-helix domain-containing protein [Pseudoalteromonas sp.]NRA78773.1 hypothetical protein [Pseudoalteromonas sp.]
MSKNSKQNKEYLAKSIIETCENFYKLNFRVRSRKNIYVIPRQVCMSLIRNIVNLSFEDIGKLFDRDHASVIYSCRKVDDYILFDKDIRYDYNQLTDKIRLENQIYIKGFSNASAEISIINSMLSQLDLNQLRDIKDNIKQNYIDGRQDKTSEEEGLSDVHRVDKVLSESLKGSSVHFFGG